MLSGDRPGACPNLTQPQLRAALADPKTGLEALLRSTTPQNLLTNVTEIVTKAKAAAPGVSQADLVNGLTVAYCPIAGQVGGLEVPANRHQLTNFTQTVYTRLAAGSY
jgi:hypothetical protein